MARLEFQGSLYMGNGKGPVIPSNVLEATIVNGAKKSRDGMVAKAGMFVDKDSALEYKGPRDRENLWSDEKFRFSVPVVVNRARIVRTRPIFENWACEVVVNYDDSQADLGQVIKWIKAAGQQVGLCDWRPRYGRFEVEMIN